MVSGTHTIPISLGILMGVVWEKCLCLAETGVSGFFQVEKTTNCKENTMITGTANHFYTTKSTTCNLLTVTKTSRWFQPI